MASTAVNLAASNKRSLQIADKNAQRLKGNAPSRKASEARSQIATKSLLFCVGGSYNTGNTAEASVYDIESKGWHSVKQTNTERLNTAAATWNDTLVVAGGETRSGVTDFVEQFDPKTGRWTTLPRLCTARSGHALANLHGSLFVFGGSDGQSILRSIERFDAECNIWRIQGTLSAARKFFAAALTKKGLVVSGGDSFDAKRSCERFSAAESYSTPIAPLNISRHSHAAATHNDKVYVFGGWRSDRGSAEIELYDGDENVWTLLKARLSLPRHELAAACVDGCIYIVGGWSDAVDVFDPATMECSRVAQLGEARKGHAVVCLSVTNDLHERFVEGKMMLN